MKISVDQRLCREYANCVVESPDVFDIDEQTDKAFALLPEPGPEQYDEVRAAAAACPVRAILLAD